ncbi:hypothetical protein F1880_007455 [Penicillium rolfsii]|nr:hypothetical protein F1880_007455 [Penicillium rolfsii]
MIGGDQCQELAPTSTSEAMSCGCMCLSNLEVEAKSELGRAMTNEPFVVGRRSMVVQRLGDFHLAATGLNTSTPRFWVDLSSFSSELANLTTACGPP